MTSAYYQAFGCWRCWRWPGQDVRTARQVRIRMEIGADCCASAMVALGITLDRSADGMATAAKVADAWCRAERQLYRQRVRHARLYLLRKRARRLWRRVRR